MLRGGTLSALIALWACHASVEPPPTILLISIDTLRADHVGVYGYERDTTPRIDRFFGPGTIFTNATSSAPCTIPSVRQFLSGGFDLNPDRKSLAEILSEHDYQTAAFVSQHQFTFETQRDYARGFDHFDMQSAEEVDHHQMTTRSARDVTEHALAWLAARRDVTRCDQDGLFLWLHYFDPHDPYEPPDPHRQFDRANVSTRSGDRRLYLQNEKRTEAEPWPQAGYVFDEADVAHFVNLYDGEIAYADAQIGRLLDALEERGSLRNAIVVLLSDHGEWLGESGWWDHCFSLREEEIRVPLAIRVRGGPLRGAHREGMPASTLDVVPTILGLLEIDFERGLYHGRDLREAPPGRAVLAMWNESIVARDREWKLFSAERSLGLFHISSDPHETRNLLGSVPAAQTRLLRAVSSARELRARIASEHEQTIRQLRSIGYVE